MSNYPSGKLPHPFKYWLMFLALALLSIPIVFIIWLKEIISGKPKPYASDLPIIHALHKEDENETNES